MKIALLFLPLALGCSAQLTPKQQARLDKFQCQVAALAPLVEPVYDATELVQDLRAGKASLSQVLQNLDVLQSEGQALVTRLDACNGKHESEPAALTPASW